MAGKRPNLVLQQTNIRSRLDAKPHIRSSHARGASLQSRASARAFFHRDTRRQAVIAQWGRPDSTRSQPVQNIHKPAQTDSVVNLFYPGLRLHYVVLGVAVRSDTDILLKADVSDNRYLKYPALGVGASAATIVSALGDPREPEQLGERASDKYRYDCERCIGGGLPVYFHFEGDRVKLVEYTFYVD